MSRLPDVPGSSLPDVPGSRHARHTDPITSRIAGRLNFNTQKLRACALVAALSRRNLASLGLIGVTRDEVEAYCSEPRPQELWGALPLGKTPWKRVSDCMPEGWVATVHEVTGEALYRRGRSGRHGGVVDITNEGREIARRVLAFEAEKRRIR